MIQIDMPMPGNCLECRFNTSEFGYCNAMPVEFVGQVNDFEEDGKPEWCPLKAQEPRVMTLEEYEAWIDTPFTERNPVFHEERTKRGAVTCWVNTAVCTLREYGKNDRCWTSRPTKEQMEETPWDAQSQREYEAAVEMAEYCERYEPTYNAEDGSM